MRNQKFADPRYEGVELPSLWRVVVREVGEDMAHATYPAAERAIVRDLRWRDWRAVRRGSQVTGYRRAKPKAWFFCPEAGRTEDCEGPFRSKNIIKSRLRIRSTRKRSAGIYDADSPEGMFVVFTRDRADSLFGAGEEERLP